MCYIGGKHLAFKFIKKSTLLPCSTVCIYGIIESTTDSTRARVLKALHELGKAKESPGYS